MTLDLFVLASTSKNVKRTAKKCLRFRFTAPLLLAIMKLTVLIFLGVSDRFKIFKLCKTCRCIYPEDDAITDGLRRNGIKEPGSRKRGLVPCVTPLSDAHTMSYRMITTYIKKLTADNSVEKLKNAVSVVVQ